MRLIDADKLIHSIDSAISLREKMGRKNNYSLINLKKIVEEYGEDFDVAEQDAMKWISCSERLPEEHESVFAKLKGTNRWGYGMFEKISDDVIVTIEDEEGQKETMTAKTKDGKWDCEWLRYHQSDCVIAWMPLPEPYNEQMKEVRNEKTNYS